MVSRRRASSSSEEIVILGQDKAPSRTDFTYYWSGYKEKSDHSAHLLQVIEQNAGELRRRFLKVHGAVHATISEKLRELSSNADIDIALLSSSLFVEKNFFKSQSLLDSLRLLALDRELESTRCKNLQYVGPQRAVAEALDVICAHHDIYFSWTKTEPLDGDSLSRKVWTRIPEFFRAMITFCHYLWTRWNFRTADLPAWFDSPDSTFFFSYFIHLDATSRKEGRYMSNVWGTLPEVLRQNGRRLNWVHLFLVSSSVPDAQTGVQSVARFNESMRKSDVHSFLEAFLGWDIIFRTLKDYLGTYVRLFFLNKKLDKVVATLPYGWMWRIHRKDWIDSTLGTSAVQNLLWFNLFDKLMASLPHQKIGLFVCENQGWERAFIRAWRTYGHGKLVGLAAPIGFWDLRYFDDLEASIDIPRADAIAVGGPDAWRKLEAAGQKMDQYVKVEAVRYLHLDDLPTDEGLEVTQAHYNTTQRLLVVGDIQTDTTSRMIETVAQAQVATRNPFEVVVKPHPASTIDALMYPSLHAEFTDQPLSLLFPEVDLVVTSAFTVAGVEALCSGARVACFLDPNGINFSILRGLAGVEFIGSSRDLVTLLERYPPNQHQRVKPTDLFWLDPELSRWRQILQLNQA